MQSLFYVCLFVFIKLCSAEFGTKPYLHEPNKNIMSMLFGKKDKTLDNNLMKKKIILHNLFMKSKNQKESALKPKNEIQRQNLYDPNAFLRPRY